MYLERPQMRVTRTGPRMLLLMTLRMNTRPSEDNAQLSVPALPANDQLCVRYKVYTIIPQLLYPAYYYESFFVDVYNKDVLQVW
jgi:hypothetical protein